ncbi:MAG TPA: type I methionyl aminopeptidase [Candidatus Acetothermia bacterium]|nr:type I methionyl aminopeptidase [Candidatus Acetothermia bacterium]
MISLKSPRELRLMAENAEILREILVELALRAEPGTSTGELDRVAERRIREAGGRPAFKGYKGYPASLCASINQEIVHGIPSDDRILREGDVLSLDLGLERKGYFADAAITVGVGEISAEAERLMAATRAALQVAVEKAIIGNRLSDISHAIEFHVRKAGYYVVKEFVGHGIGRALHEDPAIPNFGPPGKGPRLREGMVFCIEPMVKADPDPVEIKGDGWTAVARGGGPTAHYEEMVAITPEGPAVLTGWIWEEFCRRRTSSVCTAR